MNRATVLLLAMLLGGCTHKHLGLGSTATFNGQIVIVAGQSNSVELASQATPELLAALQRQFPGIDGVVACGVNGSDITSWLPGQFNFDDCIQRVASSRKVPAAVVFWQGEAEVEGEDVASIQSWPMHFTEFVSAMRKDLNASSLPVLFARLGDSPGQLPFWSMMKDEQASVTMAGVGMVSLDGIPHDASPNQLHYTQDGYRKCAARFTMGVQ